LIEKPLQEYQGPQGILVYKIAKKAFSAWHANALIELFPRPDVLSLPIPTTSGIWQQGWFQTSATS
jgi:hypothetical protein